MAQAAAVTDTAAEMREAVIAIAVEAGAAIMAVYSAGFDVEKKSDDSPLTAADLAANAIITERLHRLTPELPVLSEESPAISWAIRRHWRCYWLVDPLDGTRDFVKRNGEFSVNIALVSDGIPVLGVVQSPVSGQVWHAVHGERAWRREGGQDVPLRTHVPAMSPLRVAISRSHRDPHTKALIARMGAVREVPLGSSLKFCRLADGELDVYPRLGPTSEWDTAAGQCVLQAAGGQLLALPSGRPFEYNRRETLLNGDFVAMGDSRLPWRDWLVN